MVVIQRFLADAARHGDGQPTAEVHLPEKHVNQGGPSLHAWVPRLNNCRHFIGHGGECKGAAAEDDQNNRLSSGHHGLKQLFLETRQRDVRARSGFPGHIAGSFAEGEHDQVGASGGVNSGGNPILRTTHDVGPFS